MTTEEDLVVALIGFFDSARPVGFPAAGIVPCLNVLTGAKRVSPCLLWEVEDSEESIPLTGNMDIQLLATLITPIRGKDAVTDADHRAYAGLLQNWLRQDVDIKAAINYTGEPDNRAVNPFHLYQIYVMSGIPEPTKYGKHLATMVRVRAICIQANAG